MHLEVYLSIGITPFGILFQQGAGPSAETGFDGQGLKTALRCNVLGSLQVPGMDQNVEVVGGAQADVAVDALHEQRSFVGRGADAVVFEFL